MERKDLMMQFHCLICDTKILSALRGQQDDAESLINDGCLDGAVLAKTYGGYGSTIIDAPMEGTGIAYYFCICDECLKNKGHRIIRGVTEQPNPTTFTRGTLNE